MNTEKRVLWFLGLTLAAASVVSCSEKESLPLQTETQIYTLTTTLALQEDPATRSILSDPENGSLTAQWEVGDKVWVSYTQSDDTHATAQASVTAVDVTTKTATISVNLIDPKDGDSALFGFPYDHWNSGDDPHTGQTGTLDGINTLYNVLSGSGALSVSGSDVTLPTGVAMAQEMAIWKFTFTDKSSDADITSSITSLSISFDSGGFVDEYVITPSDLSTIYAAIYGGTSGDLTITATGTAGTYSISKASISLVAGKLYTSSGLKLTKQLIYPITLSSVTADYIGSVVTSDGYVYATVATATEASKTAVAMIAYVGSETGNVTYNNGMALSLANECHYEYWATAENACKSKTPVVPNAQWVFPSESNWRTMMATNGGNNNNYSGLNALISASGGVSLCTEDTEHRYWAEKAGMNSAKKLNFKNDGSVVIGYSNPNNDTYGDGRACLVF